MILPLTVVIPTYRPAPDVVTLASTVAPRVGNLVVSDDASPCTFDPVLRELSDVASVIHHETNTGIARGLNEGLASARKAGHAWLLTLDQDSRVDESYLECIYAFASGVADTGARVGAVGAQFVCTSGKRICYPETVQHGLRTTHEVFQSGTLWNVPALTSAGGFDEELGIDAVDAAACLRLRERGSVIALADELVLDHRWGETEFITIGNRSIALTHHSPERRRTMVRNRLRLAPAEFRQSPTHAARTLRRLGVGTSMALLRESNRRAKLAATFGGLWGATKR